MGENEEEEEKNSNLDATIISSLLDNKLKSDELTKTISHDQ